MQCPVNFSEAADRILNGLQVDFLWPMLVVEFLVALAGNSLALYRFCSREQRPWPPAVIFSAQLAVSDLLYALTLPPLAAYIYPPKNWRYGEAACRLERFLFTCNLLGSVIFITCISLNRYMGIVHPFFAHSQLRPKHAWAVSTIGWALAVLLAAPTLSFSHLSVSQRQGQCSVASPGACTKCLGTASDSQLEAYRVYSLALATLGSHLVSVSPQLNCRKTENLSSQTTPYVSSRPDLSAGSLRQHQKASHSYRRTPHTWEYSAHQGVQQPEGFFFTLSHQDQIPRDEVHPLESDTRRQDETPRADAHPLDSEEAALTPAAPPGPAAVQLPPASSPPSLSFPRTRVILEWLSRAALASPALPSTDMCTQA